MPDRPSLFDPSRSSLAAATRHLPSMRRSSRAVVQLPSLLTAPPPRPPASPPAPASTRLTTRSGSAAAPPTATSASRSGQLSRASRSTRRSSRRVEPSVSRGRGRPSLHSPSLSSASVCRTSENFRTRLHDMWNFVGLTSGADWPLPGYPWITRWAPPPSSSARFRRQTADSPPPASQPLRLRAADVVPALRALRPGHGHRARLADLRAALPRPLRRARPPARYDGHAHGLRGPGDQVHAHARVRTAQPTRGRPRRVGQGIPGRICDRAGRVRLVAGVNFKLNRKCSSLRQCRLFKFQIATLASAHCQSRWHHNDHRLGVLRVTVVKI